MKISVSPLAYVSPLAKIGENTQILPFSFIDDDVEIGANCWIGPNVSILSGARIAHNCQIFPGAVIGAIPQDLKFNGEYTTAEIGAHTTIREFVTVNRGTVYANKTVVGSHCLLMAYVHVAHDCVVGNHVILANNTNLAGHVHIEDYAILEGFVGVQQFMRIGTHSFIAANSFVRKNVPPYVRAAREPLSYIGVNTVGLTRRGFDKQVIEHIQNIYRHIFVMGYALNKAIELVENNTENSLQKDIILRFIQNSDKGIIKGLPNNENKNSALPYED